MAARTCSGGEAALAAGVARGGFGLAEAGPGRPGGAGGILQHRAGFVVHGAEQVGEAGIDRGGVGRPPRVLLGQEGRIGATEGGRQNVDTSHLLRSLTCRAVS